MWKNLDDIKIWLENIDTSYQYFFQILLTLKLPSMDLSLENYWRVFFLTLKKFKCIFSESFLLCSVYDSENLEQPNSLMTGDESHIWAATKIHDLHP